MSESSPPTSFRDGEFGWVPGVLLGGPFDGSRYRMPMLPDGEIPDSISCPLGEHPNIVGYAEYQREGDEAVGGYHVYFFVDSDAEDAATRAVEASVPLSG